MNEKVKKYLILGLIGSFITVVAELLQGLVPSGEATNVLAELFSTIENLPVWRIGLGSTVGGIGILMQFYGYYGLYLTLDNKENRLAGMYKRGVYVFTIIGSIVHILMSMLMYVYKISFQNEEILMERMIDFSIWFCGPILAGFFIFYFTMSLSMFILLFKGRTPFPKWFAFLNPLIGKAVIGAITKVLPLDGAFINGIGFANMGITSVIIVTALLIYFCKNEKNDL